MSVYRRMQTLYRNLSTGVNIASGATGATLATVDAGGAYTIFLQKIHIEITTGSSGKTWNIADSGTGAANIIPSLDAGAISHYDFDFGQYGMPLEQGKNLILTPSAAGAAGKITIEAYQKPTAVMTLATS